MYRIHRLIAAILLTFSIMNASADTIVIGHRGNSTEAPENTLASVRSAAALDPAPRYIEIDIHRSSDGVLVVSHDDNTKRITGVDAMIRNKPFAWLRTLDAGYAHRFGDKFQGEKLPRLEEVLDVVKDKNIGIMIECKQLLVEDSVIELLRQRGELGKHVLASFDEMTIYRAKKIEPKLRTLYLSGKFNETQIGRMKDVKADIMGINFGDNAPDIMKQAHELNIPIWVWTVDNYDDYKAWIDAGVDGIITNRPADVLSVILK